MFAPALLLTAAAGLWLDVPFVPQEKNGCGSASIAMVMRYWMRNGAKVAPSDADPEQIQRALYSESAEGIYASAMERYFREKQFRTFAFRGSWEELGEHLAKGRPLIVCLKEGPLHYVVVAGLDPARGLVLMNDPARRKLLKLDRGAFESRWKDRWTLLAVPRQPR